MKKDWETFAWFFTLKIDFDSQILALVDTSLLHQFSKFKFPGKIISNFLPPAWKLDDPVLPLEVAVLA